MDPSDATWLVVRISEVDGDGVDSRALSRVLMELSNAMFASARFALGDRRQRKGPPTSAESGLASLKITSVTKGSIVLQYGRPPGVPPAPPGLAGLEQLQVDPDQVGALVIDAIVASGAGSAIEPGTEFLRRSTRRFLEAAAKVGDECVLELKTASLGALRAQVSLRSLARNGQVQTQEREVMLFGHVYMADVEMGRQRLRVRLPNDSDATIEIIPELRDLLLELLDKPVLLRVVERLNKGFIVGRRITAAEVLPRDLSGPEKPPHSLTELAAAQGLLHYPVPDYSVLASAVWPTSEDAAKAISLSESLRKATA